MKQNAIIVLRWIGVLPCALLGSIITYLLVYYCQHWYFGEDSLYGHYIVPCQASLASGIAFTHYGVKIAPAYKKYTAITIIVLVLLLMGAGMLVTVVQRRWMDFVKDIASVIGVLVGYGFAEVIE